MCQKCDREGGLVSRVALADARAADTFVVVDWSRTIPEITRNAGEKPLRFVYFVDRITDRESTNRSPSYGSLLDCFRWFVSS
jgi:hypothetical protein